MVEAKTPDAKAEANAKTSIAKHAREIFTQTVAINGGRVSAEGLASECFRFADAFKSAETAFYADTLVVAEQNPILSYVSAPNLRKDHPVNLMSSAYGNVDEIRRHLAAIKDLDRTDWDKRSHADIVYDEARWTKADVNQAEALLPEFLSRAERLTRAAAEVAATKAKNELLAASN